MCLIDPLCCSIAWDADCVVFAELYCLQCTPGFAPPSGSISVPADFYPASKASPKKIAKMKMDAKQDGPLKKKSGKKAASKSKP